MRQGFRLTAGLFIAALCASTIAADGNIIPERYNKGPRILFNTKDKDKLDEIVPGQFYQKYWHGPRLTVQHVRFVRDQQGNHVKITEPGGYHGEEAMMVLEGRLRFKFPDSGKAYEIGPGDVFHFPNVLHHGVCLTDECHIVVVYSPNRADFGPEGSKMTIESNDALSLPE